MILSTNTLAQCTGASAATAASMVSAIASAMSEYEIDRTPLRAAMFLANVGHESQRMERLVEGLNYSVEALLTSFGRHRISEAEARAYGRTAARAADQQAIANTIYGGPWGVKNLGNTQAGDGWKFRGRGLIQVTGRSNAATMRDRLRRRMPNLSVPDFEVRPEALSLPMWAAYSAAAYWDRHSLNDMADSGDFDGVCDVINFGSKTGKVGDTKGFEDRVKLLEAGQRALGIA